MDIDNELYNNSIIVENPRQLGRIECIELIIQD